MIPNSVVYNVPVWRLQRGNSAVIMDPVVGDIGIIASCDRDNSIVRANRKQSVPGSKRTHSKTDAIYFGGVLNNQPTQYVQFADNAINRFSRQRQCELQYGKYHCARRRKRHNASDARYREYYSRRKHHRQQWDAKRIAESTS
jgi:hypothetical protein